MPRPTALLLAAALPLISAQSLPVGTSTHTLTHDGRTRTFIVNRAAGVGESRRSPAGLVFVWHGYTNTASWMNSAASVASIGAANGFIGVSPQGVNAGGNCFNAGLCCGSCPRQNIDDVGFARAMVAYIEERASVDRDRVFTTGYSNGHMMSYRLACQAGDLFKAAGGAGGSYASVGGGCSPSAALTRQQVHMHGTNDAIIGYTGANNAYQRYVRDVQDCTDSYPGSVIYTNPSYYDMTCYSRSRCVGGASAFCVYTGMGHIWPTNALLRQWNFWTKGEMSAVGANETTTDTAVIAWNETWGL